MRITNKTLTENFLRNLSQNLNQMSQYQNQLSSGKVVTKPSEDPMLVSKIMDLRNSVGINEQNNTNIGDALGWVQTQDGALNSGSGILQRIRELIVYGANDTLAPQDRQAIKDEVVQNIEALRDVFNTNFDGRYVFGGQKTKTPPFQFTKEDGMTYHGDENNIQREIAKGVHVELLTSGSQFLGEGAEGLGALLKNVVSALEGNDTQQLSGSLLEKVDQKMEDLLSLRSKIGAMDNRLQASLSRNEEENIQLNGLLSKKEDIDVAEKFMEYSVMSTVYQASLAAGSKILQPSLLDYLR